MRLHLLDRATDWEHPKISEFKKLYNFLNYINPNKVQLILNLQADSFKDIPINKDVVIVTTFDEAPRTQALKELAVDYPSVYFICLADVNFYDFAFPTNVYVFKYRH